MERYSKKEFEGFTHRFIVKMKVDNDWRNDISLDVYSNSGSYLGLENFITQKKSDKIAFTIIHRASKEQDEMSAKVIDEVFKDL